MSWEDKEAESVRKLVESLPKWDKSLEGSETLPFASSLQRGVLSSGLQFYHRLNAAPRDHI